MPETYAARVDTAHRHLAEAFDLATLSSLPRDDVPEALRPHVERAVQATWPDAPDPDAVVDSVMDEVLGLGPLEPLLRDQGIARIDVDGPQEITVWRAGDDAPAEVVFHDIDHLERIAGRILGAIGSDPADGPVTSTMRDGSTFHAHRDNGRLKLRIDRPDR